LHSSRISSVHQTKEGEMKKEAKRERREEKRLKEE
jgi:hypothetical protein